MRLLDTILVVDWSAASGVRRAGPDAIWIGVVRDGVEGEPLHMPTRRDAEAWLEDTLRGEIAAGRRVLAAFDFPFGYPAGFARAVTGRDDPLALWDWLAARIEDDERGRNNRFAVASELNGLFPGIGPFWGKPSERDWPDIPYRGTARAGHGMAETRTCDRAARASSTVWQLAFPPTVGGQALTGLPVLSRLRRIDGVAVWPFEPWHDAPAVLAEIWPGLVEGAVRDAGAGIRDRHQVRLLARALAALPPEEAARLMEGLPPEAAEEGWILGAGAAAGARLTELARSAPGGGRLAPPPLLDTCFALPPGVEWTLVDVALERLRHRLRPVGGEEEVETGSADGRILSRPARARRANPPGANAAVDGYGFAHAATGAGAQRLPLVRGRAAAGAPHGEPVPHGSAIRILTGALLPAGVDTVVLEEDTRSDGAAVAFNGPVRPGANTRRAGEDVAAGAEMLPAGHRLRPVDLALLSATGVARVAVRRALRVGVLSTGDEIVAAGAPDDPARTFDANRPMLLSMVRRWGHLPVDMGHAPDDRDRLRAALDAAGADVIVTSGGASAGDEDHVSALLRDEGALSAWRIALKPGRPLALGLRDGVPVFGLPGNPVASFVCAVIFARPALAVLAGAPWPEPVAMTLPAAFEKDKKPGRREYLRARIGAEGGVETFASEGSGRISGLSWAQGLVELPDGAARIRPGDPVRFLPYWGMDLG